jgi:hypothetical protein
MATTFPGLYGDLPTGKDEKNSQELEVRQKFSDEYAIKSVRDLKHYHSSVRECFKKSVYLFSMASPLTGTAISPETMLIEMPLKKSARTRIGREAVMATINSSVTAKNGIMGTGTTADMHGFLTLPDGTVLGGFNAKDVNSVAGTTVWCTLIELQTRPILRVEVKLWHKQLSKSAPFHILRLVFPFNAIGKPSDETTAPVRGIQNFQKVVTEPKCDDGSLDFNGEVSFHFE